MYVLRQTNGPSPVSGPERKCLQKHGLNINYKLLRFPPFNDANNGDNSHFLLCDANYHGILIADVGNY